MCILVKKWSSHLLNRRFALFQSSYRRNYNFIFSVVTIYTATRQHSTETLNKLERGPTAPLFKNSGALSGGFVVTFSTHFPPLNQHKLNFWSSYGCSRFVVYRRTGSWVCAVVQFERKDTSSWPEFMGVRGSACSSNDGESYKASSEVMLSYCALINSQWC